MKRKKATDEAMKVTELEAMKFAKMDSDVRMHLMSARNAELELDILHRNYLLKKGELENTKLLATQQVETLKPQYMEYVKALASKYKVNPEKMIIDPDTGVIREA